MAPYRTQLRVPGAVPAARSNVAPVDFSPLADVASGFADQLAALEAAEQRAQRAEENMAARSTALQGLATLEADLAERADHDRMLPDFDEQVSGLREQVLSGLSTPAQQAEMRAEFDLWSTRSRIGVREQVHARKVDAYRASLDGQLTGLAERAASARYGVDLDMTTEAARTILNEAAAGGYITREAAQAQLERFKAETQETAALQLVTADPVRAGRVLAKAENFPQLDPQKRERLIQQGQREAEARQREAEARARAAEARRRSDRNAALKLIDGYADIAASGVTPSAHYLDQARQLAGGDPAVEQRIGQVQAQQRELDGLRTESPAALGQYAAALRQQMNARGATRENVEFLKTVDRLAETASREIERDPLAWAAQQGFEMAPVEFTDPSSLEARLKVAVRAAKYNDTPLTIFTKDERGRLARAYEAADPDGQMALSRSIMTGLGKVHGPNAMAEIAEEATVPALLGGLLGVGKAATAQKGFLGLAAMRDGADVVPNGAAKQLAIENTLGAAFGPETAGMQTAIIDAADAIYTADATRRGLTRDMFDPDLYADALELAVGGGGGGGGIATWNGREIVLAPSMNERRFRFIMAGLRDEELESLSLTGGAPVFAGSDTAVTAEDIRAGWLVTRDDGQYVVSLTNPAQRPEYLRDARTGDVFILDLTRWEAAVEGRPLPPGRGTTGDRATGEDG